MRYVPYKQLLQTVLICAIATSCKPRDSDLAGTEDLIDTNYYRFLSKIVGPSGAATGSAVERIVARNSSSQFVSLSRSGGSIHWNLSDADLDITEVRARASSLRNLSEDALDDAGAEGYVSEDIDYATNGKLAAMLTPRGVAVAYFEDDSRPQIYHVAQSHGAYRVAIHSLGERFAVAFIKKNIPQISLAASTLTELESLPKLENTDTGLIEITTNWPLAGGFPEREIELDLVPGVDREPYVIVTKQDDRIEMRPWNGREASRSGPTRISNDNLASGEFGGTVESWPTPRRCAAVYLSDDIAPRSQRGGADGWDRWYPEAQITSCADARGADDASRIPGSITSFHIKGRLEQRINFESMIKLTDIAIGTSKGYVIVVRDEQDGARSKIAKAFDNVRTNAENRQRGVRRSFDRPRKMTLLTDVYLPLVDDSEAEKFARFGSMRCMAIAGDRSESYYADKTYDASVFEASEANHVEQSKDIIGVDFSKSSEYLVATSRAGTVHLLRRPHHDIRSNVSKSIYEDAKSRGHTKYLTRGLSASHRRPYGTNISLYAGPGVVSGAAQFLHGPDDAQISEDNDTKILIPTRYGTTYIWHAGKAFTRVHVNRHTKRGEVLPVVTAVAGSADGELVASAAYAPGERESSLPEFSRLTINTIDFSSSDDYEGNRDSLFSTTTNTKVETLDFSVKGNYLLYVDNVVKLIDLKTFEEKILQTQGTRYTVARFGGIGDHYIYAGTPYGTVEIYDISPAATAPQVPEKITIPERAQVPRPTPPPVRPPRPPVKPDAESDGQLSEDEQAATEFSPTNEELSEERAELSQTYVDAAFVGIVHVSGQDPQTGEGESLDLDAVVGIAPYPVNGYHRQGPGNTCERCFAFITKNGQLARVFQDGSGRSRITPNFRDREDTKPNLLSYSHTGKVILSARSNIAYTDLQGLWDGEAFRPRNNVKEESIRVNGRVLAMKFKNQNAFGGNPHEVVIVTPDRLSVYDYITCDHREARYPPIYNYDRGFGNQTSDARFTAMDVSDSENFVITGDDHGRVQLWWIGKFFNPKIPDPNERDAVEGLDFGSQDAQAPGGNNE